VLDTEVVRPAGSSSTCSTPKWCAAAPRAHPP